MGVLTIIFDSRRAVAIYLNAFCGDVTLEFPSTLQMSRGGVLI